MTRALPLVSVVITTFNREEYVAEAIESVLASEYENLEIIVSDDASADTTFSIAQKFAEANPSIRLYRNTTNLGQFANRNKAIGYAAGYYIMQVDSDDKLLPGVVTRSVQAIQQFEHDNFGMLAKVRDTAAPMYLDAATAIQRNFFEKPFLGIGPGSTIIKKSFFEEIGGYTDEFGAVGDMYFNLKACARGGIILMPWDFVDYRLHEKQELNNPFSYLVNGFRYQDAAVRDLALPLNKKQLQWIANKNRRRFVTNVARFLATTGDVNKALAAVKLAGFKATDLLKGIFH